MFKFRNEKLCYENNPEQFREVHCVKEEKRLRYEYLKSEVLKKMEGMKLFYNCCIEK